jgi:hypothetical protein
MAVLPSGNRSDIQPIIMHSGEPIFVVRRKPIPGDDDIPLEQKVRVLKYALQIATKPPSKNGRMLTPCFPSSYLFGLPLPPAIVLGSHRMFFGRVPGRGVVWLEGRFNERIEQ